MTQSSRCNGKYCWGSVRRAGHAENFTSAIYRNSQIRPRSGKPRNSWKNTNHANAIYEAAPGAILRLGSYTRECVFVESKLFLMPTCFSVRCSTLINCITVHWTVPSRAPIPICYFLGERAEFFLTFLLLCSSDIFFFSHKLDRFCT